MNYQNSSLEDVGGEIKTILPLKMSHQINKCKKHRFLSSCNLYSPKSDYKVLLK